MLAGAAAWFCPVASSKVRAVSSSPIGARRQSGWVRGQVVERWQRKSVVSVAKRCSSVVLGGGLAEVEIVGARDARAVERLWCCGEAGGASGAEV